MRLLAIIVGFGLFAITQAACASPWKTGSIYNGSTLSETRLDDVVRDVSPGTVVIVSENHGIKPHHDNQVQFLEALAHSGVSKISVGMEFFSRTVQDAVDQFLRGTLGEADFLKQAEWGGTPFDLYRRQVLFPKDHGGRTIAINAPRSLSGKVSKVGLEGLSPEEKDQLPPNFTLGNVGYFERFKETMQGHVPAEKIQRYFEAQSLWDETMAFVTTEYMKANPDQVFVIIVGDFHAAYGGGLPDRLKARGASRVLTVSQVYLNGASGSEEDELIYPDSQWGPRADFIWVAR